MADYSAIDFSEIDELCNFVDGKGGSKFNLFDIDEDVEINAGIPSHGLMDDDAMLAVDSSNALIMGDPLLNAFDQNELLELQSASPSHNPETLMPVSLPADSPPRLHAISPPASPDSSPAVPDSPTAVEAGSKGDGAATNAIPSQEPVRIIVKTKKNTGEMVAPLSLPQPAHNLVRIPKSGSTTQLARLRTLRTGGKLGPTVTGTRILGTTTPTVTRIPVTVRKLLPPSSQQPSEPARKRLCVTPGTASADDGVADEGLPFRSLRARNNSESSVGSQASTSIGMKRKAYELDPLEDPEMERCRRNAVNAKRNREQKKAQLAELERTVESVSRERDQLAGENESLREAKMKLEQQVKHLSNILKNQSKLSEVISKLGMTSVVLGEMTTSAEEEVVSSASGR
ncbi:uncharacterized protein LOC119591601 [Penaeus monodon]|uniref:uncharacterized protein LOC119591601 n=2 Tax=Penaeus TaxID=133894 RepID=UPI0018A70093|nr:uncharacterized protein LOC119591601 [Penaeus monodon]